MTGRVVAEDELGGGRGLDTEELSADRHASIGADFDRGPHAPDEGPPVTARDGTQDAAFLLLGQIPGALRFHVQFPVNLVLVAMKAQVPDVKVGLVDVGDLFTGEVSGQALLPEEVAAFDFAFGLRGWGIAETDAIEVQCLAQLGQGMGIMGKEQAVKIDVDLQRQAILDEGGGQEIQIGQQEFPFIDFGAGENPAAVIEHIDHGKEARRVGEPRVGRGIQLPELTNAAALPTLDRSRCAAVGPGVSEVICDGPATNLSPVDFEVAFTKHLAGGEAIGSWRFAAEPLAQKSVHFERPIRRVVTTRHAGGPGGLLVMSADRQIVGVELVETRPRKAQAAGGSLGLEFLGPEGSQHMTN